MIEETTVSQGLNAVGDSASYDAACKRILSETAVLARIMKACLEEYKDCDVNEIAERYIEGSPQISTVPVLPDEEGKAKSSGESKTIITGMDTEDKSMHEGTIVYDIRFRAILPGTGERVELIINVEAQANYYPGYPLIMRAVYYACRMISSQYGREFKNSKYGNIKKVYSIWICMNPPEDRQNSITRYRLVEENLVGNVAEVIANYDLVSIVMICLGGPGSDNYNGIIRMLDVLLSNETNTADKRKILEEDYGIEMSHVLEGEVSSMCNLSEALIAKGEARGIAKGRAEARVENTLLSIKSLMKTTGMSAETAMAALEIPKEEQPRYWTLLKQ